jgi:hypothetical protein
MMRRRPSSLLQALLHPAPAGPADMRHSRGHAQHPNTCAPMVDRCRRGMAMSASVAVSVAVMQTLKRN